MITALLVTLILQTLATMAAFSLAAVAPAVAADLNIDGNLIGFFVSVVYGVGVLSAVGSVTFIHRHGPARVGQIASRPGRARGSYQMGGGTALN